MHGPSHVCQMKRYVFTCFNFLGNCCSTLEPFKVREKDTKAQIQVSCVWEPCLLYALFCWEQRDNDKGTRGRGQPLLLQTYFSLLRVLFLSEMLNLLTAVVSYLIYFICGIYLSVAFLLAFLTLDTLGIQFLAFLFSLSAYFNVIQLTWLGLFHPVSPPHPFDHSLVYVFVVSN